MKENNRAMLPILISFFSDLVDKKILDRYEELEEDKINDDTKVIENNSEILEVLARIATDCVDASLCNTEEMIKVPNFREETAIVPTAFYTRFTRKFPKVVAFYTPTVREIRSLHVDEPRPVLRFTVKDSKVYYEVEEVVNSKEGEEDEKVVK